MPQSKEVHKEYMRLRREGSQTITPYEAFCQKKGIAITQRLKPIDTATDSIVFLNGKAFWPREWLPSNA